MPSARPTRHKSLFGAERTTSENPGRVMSYPADLERNQ
jgi:hypothetical protein